MNIALLVHLVPSRARELLRKSVVIRLYESPHSGEFYVSQFSYENLRAQKIPHQVLKRFTEKDIPVEVVYPARFFLFDPPDPDALHEAMTFALSKRKGRRKIALHYLGRGKESSEQTGSFTLDRPGGKRSYHWLIPRKKIQALDIRKQFPKMVRRIKNKDTRVLLSFGSGGIRMFAHPSLMKFIDLMDLRDDVDEIWGSSGGAIAGLPYSVGVDPFLIEEEGYHLYNNRYDFRLSPSKMDVLKNLVTDVFLPSSDNQLKGFIDVQNHLRSLIEKHLKVTKRKIPFYCVAYNLKERHNEILTPEEVDPEIYITPIVQTDALDAVIASSSIPILYVPKKILRGETEHIYIDGGTTEEVPLISPYRKWIRDRMYDKEKRSKLLILAVNLFPTVGTSSIFTHWVFKRIPALKILESSAAYADMIRQARIDEHKSTLERDKDVTYWELTLPDVGSGVVNTKLIPKVIEAAHRGFYDQLRKIEEGL